MEPVQEIRVVEPGVHEAAFDWADVSPNTFLHEFRIGGHRRSRKFAARCRHTRKPAGSHDVRPTLLDINEPVKQDGDREVQPTWDHNKLAAKRQAKGRPLAPEPRMKEARGTARMLYKNDK